MHIRNVIINLCTIGFFITLIACSGGGKEFISQADIDTAERNGTLNSLYQKATNFIGQNSGSTKNKVVKQRSKIAVLLVKENKAIVELALAQHTKDNTSVDRRTLLDLKTSITGMKAWSISDHTALNRQLDKALTRVNRLIKRAVLEANRPSKKTIEKILSYQKAAKLAGANQPETKIYQKKLKKQLSLLLYKGNDAVSKKLYNTAINAARSGLRLDPENTRFSAMLSKSLAARFEKDFKFALENGKPESAYESFVLVADDPVFLKLKKTMGKRISILSNYFAGNAQKAYKKGRLLSAYQNLKKARNIQIKVSQSKKPFPQEKKFLALVMSKTRQSGIKDGKKYALLNIIKEFNPAYPKLKGNNLKLENKIKKRAKTKLYITGFKEIDTNQAVLASIGRRVSSKLEAALFKLVGNQVTIIRSTKANQAKIYNGLALKIDGEILQAAIERSRNFGKRSKRVQTGIKQIETKEYQIWAKRKRGDPPQRYTEKAIFENINIRVEHISKQTVVELAYKLAEVGVGNIVMANNLVIEEEYSGESINEYQKGDFLQPHVRANLPSDIKVSDLLSTALTDQLGQKLAKYLKSPEIVFYQKHQKAKKYGRKVAAIENLANAVVLKQSKEDSDGIWFGELKELALK